jgi:hypothetical protein
MLEKFVQLGRSERRPEAYPLGYVEDLSDERTTLAGFFSILLDNLAVLHMHDAVGLGGQFIVVSDDESPPEDARS